MPTLPGGKIRTIIESDVDVVVSLVHDLAAYERAPQECHLTPAQLRAALFGDDPALFGHVAELDGQIAGFVLWYLTFSTWTGTRGIHVEDLYVRPEHRGTGLGKALKATLAHQCVRHGFDRMEGCVLTWNTGFHRAIGGMAMKDWSIYRWNGPALTTLAAAAEAWPPADRSAAGQKGPP